MRKSAFAALYYTSAAPKQHTSFMFYRCSLSKTSQKVKEMKYVCAAGSLVKVLMWLQ